MNRRAWLIYVIAQCGGEIAFWIWERVPSVAGLMFSVWLLGLFPGNLFARMLVEKLFWRSYLTDVQLYLIELPLELAINAIIWFASGMLVVKLIRTVRRVSDREGN